MPVSWVAQMDHIDANFEHDHIATGCVLAVFCLCYGCVLAVFWLAVCVLAVYIYIYIIYVCAQHFCSLYSIVDRLLLPLMAPKAKAIVNILRCLMKTALMALRSQGV
jgi:hypothetical protein